MLALDRDKTDDGFARFVFISPFHPLSSTPHASSSSSGGGGGGNGGGTTIKSMVVQCADKEIDIGELEKKRYGADDDNDNDTMVATTTATTMVKREGSEKEDQDQYKHQTKRPRRYYKHPALVPITNTSIPLTSVSFSQGKPISLPKKVQRSHREIEAHRHVTRADGGDMLITKAVTTIANVQKKKQQQQQEQEEQEQRYGDDGNSDNSSGSRSSRDSMMTVSSSSSSSFS